MSLSSCGLVVLVICSQLSYLKNSLLLVLPLHVLPSVPGPQESETRKSLFLYVTYFPSLGRLGVWLKGPGTWHVNVRCSAGEWQRLETQENTALKFLGLYSDKPFSD